MRVKYRSCLRYALFLLVVGLFPACSGGSQQPVDEGHPVSSGGGASAPTNNSGVQYQAPDGWIKVQPSSSMRQAQFRLPRAEGDSEDGEMVAFYFGPNQGGSVEANVSRWIGQFSKSDGSPVGDQAQVEKRQVNGNSVTVVDVSGTYTGSSGPMMQGGPAKPDFRMLAAIIETSQGPWFFKLTGPKRTIDKWEASFDEFVNSLRAS